MPATPEQAIRKLQNLRTNLTNLLANESQNYFQDNFNRQSFTNTAETPWKPRRVDFDPGRNVLVKSGALRRSIRGIAQSITRFSVTSSLPYAAIHNNGGKINITPKMRKFFWAQAKRFEGRGRQSSRGEFWKRMAIKQTPIIIPKRRFIGQSAALKRLLTDFTTRQIKQAFV